jgi:hypothetical protein
MMNDLVELQMLQPEKKSQEIEIAPDGLSLDLLRAVYRSNHLPLPIRMRATMACLPHKFSKLIATAVVNEQSFTEVLERRLKRIEEIKLVEAQPQTIDGTDARLPKRVPSGRNFALISNFANNIFATSVRGGHT